MTKRPSPHKTLQLSIELLHSIPKRGTITAMDLQKKLANNGFSREPRTIQRLLESLCDADLYGIERDMSSKPYRYRWKESAKGLAIGSLSPQECLLLTLAEQQLGSLLPTKLMKSMDGFFDQARSQLGETAKTQRELEWLDKVRVVSTSQPLLPPKIDPDVFEQVSNALYGNQWLEVEYQNAAGKRTSSKVMPLGLAQQGPRLYLVCRYDGFEDERCLALHRMIAAQASTLTFERPEDFDLKQFDDDGRFGYGDGTQIRLSFRIEKGAGLHVVECPLSADQRVVELDDAYEITATVVDSALLDWWLRGFGAAISAKKIQYLRVSNEN
jgi:predicted DNA-binding transcriptional regulator YafY